MWKDVLPRRDDVMHMHVLFWCLLLSQNAPTRCISPTRVVEKPLASVEYRSSTSGALFLLSITCLVCFCSALCPNQPCSPISLMDSSQSVPEAVNSWLQSIVAWLQARVTCIYPPVFLVERLFSRSTPQRYPSPSPTKPWLSILTSSPRELAISCAQYPLVPGQLPMNYVA